MNAPKKSFAPAERAGEESISADAKCVDAEGLSYSATAQCLLCSLLSVSPAVHI
jgi:hypothetical protein